MLIYILTREKGVEPLTYDFGDHRSTIELLSFAYVKYDTNIIFFKHAFMYLN